MLSVLKVGGSLYDHPRLGEGLRRWLNRRDPSERFLIVPGGGQLANAVRDLHRIHALTEETSHWLALGTMSLAARFLHALLPGSEVVAAVPAMAPLAIVDALSFARSDQGQPGELEHSWRVTSDSIAARIAAIASADRLIVFKSTDAAVDLFDDAFSTNLAAAGVPLEIVSFRAQLDE